MAPAAALRHESARRVQSRESASGVRLTNVAEAAGLRFVYQHSPTPEKYFVESVPGGVAVFDYNGDGRPDIFFTNGAKTPALEKVSPIYSNRLYRNDGGMRFTDVTTAAGLSGTGYAIGAAAGDFDNDGHVDLFVAGVRTNQLYRNRGDGRFEDVTKAAGIASGDFAVGGGWFDYDNDGRLDLLVVNYVQWSAGQESVLRRRGAADQHLLPPARLPGAAEPPLPQSRRPHVRGRVGARRPAGARRQGHERVVRRLRPRRPPRHLRHQRRGAELPVPQQRRRHVHGNGARSPACRCRTPAARRPAWASMPRTTTTTAGRTSTSPR